MEREMMGDVFVDYGTLQWGHDFSVMESIVLSAILFISEPLQWGHDFSVMESISTNIIL